MSSRVIINVTETGGGGDPPGNDPLGDGLYLPSTYDGVPFYVIFEFLIEETTIDPLTELETTITFPATTVTSGFNWEQYDIIYSKVNNYTVRLDGPVRNAFPDQYYRFAMPDGSLQILPFDTTQEFYSLIQYQMPVSQSILLSYPFSVNMIYDPSVFHWVVWEFQSAVSNIDALVAKGIK
jgi:hypothetical protein